MPLERIDLPPVPLRTWKDKRNTEHALINAYTPLTERQRTGLCTVVWTTVSTKRELLAPDTAATAATAVVDEPGALVWCTLRRIGKGKAALSFDTLLGKDNPFSQSTLDAALDLVDAWADELGGQWLREVKHLNERYTMPIALNADDLRELQAYIAGMPE